MLIKGEFAASSCHNKDKSRKYLCFLVILILGKLYYVHQV